MDQDQEGEAVKIEEIEQGMLITNGSSAMLTTEHVKKDRNWGAPGWRGQGVGLYAFDGNVGMTVFVPDYLLRDWRVLPEDWTPVVGGGLEERYVEAAPGRMIREVRKVEAS
jgi:hypothetical protein